MKTLYMVTIQRSVLLISKYIVGKLYIFLYFYKEQISSYYCTSHNMSMNEISLILPNFPKDRKGKISIIASLMTGFNGLVYECISSYLHKKGHKTLHKVVAEMDNKMNLQWNKIIHLEDSMVMNRIYNSETLEKLIATVHKMHNSTTPNEKLFAGTLSSRYTWYLTKDGIGHYAMNSLLYLRMLKRKVCKMYEEFINQLHIYAK